MDRKDFFVKGFQLAVGKGLELLGDNPISKGIEKVAEQVERNEKIRERPPGAITPDKSFRETCTGCDQCMMACPENVIMIDDMENRFPVIYPEESPCLHCEGYPCIQSCDSKALTLSLIKKS